MNIYERLIQDHDAQRGLAAQLAETSGDSELRRRLFENLKTELVAHADAEEQTFYAELIAIPDGQGKARHSIVEHQEAADLIKELEKTDMGTGEWLKKFKKLAHEVVHHVDEEEADIFPLAAKLIPDDRAKELASEFNSRKFAEATEHRSKAS